MKTSVLFLAAALVGFGGYLGAYFLFAPPAGAPAVRPSAPSVAPAAIRPTDVAPSEPQEAGRNAEADAAKAEAPPAIGRVLEKAAALQSHARAGADASKVERRAATAAGRERLERGQVSELLDEAFASMLPDRSFSAQERERLTDAVLRVRAARRVLKRIDPSRESADVLARERAELTDALAEFERVSGIPPSDLTELLEPQAGLSNDEDEDEGAPLAPTEDDPEFLEDR